MKIQRIGISGLMGAGKSTCGGFFIDSLKKSAKEVRLVDADNEAKIMMHQDKALQKKLIESFGEAVVCKGEVVFPVLGALAFSALSQLLTLNRIVHPPLLKRLEELIFAKADVCIICDAALIPLWHVEEWFDTLIWVQASFEKRHERLAKKLLLKPDELTKRMELQQKLLHKPEKTPWKILINHGTLDELQAQTLSSCAAIISCGCVGSSGSSNRRSLSSKD